MASHLVPFFSALDSRSRWKRWVVLEIFSSPAAIPQELEEDRQDHQGRRTQEPKQLNYNILHPMNLYPLGAHFRKLLLHVPNVLNHDNKFIGCLSFTWFMQTQSYRLCGFFSAIGWVLSLLCLLMIGSWCIRTHVQTSSVKYWILWRKRKNISVYYSVRRSAETHLHIRSNTSYCVSLHRHYSLVIQQLFVYSAIVFYKRQSLF